MAWEGRVSLFFTTALGPKGRGPFLTQDNQIKQIG